MNWAWSCSSALGQSASAPRWRPVTSAAVTPSADDEHLAVVLVGDVRLERGEVDDPRRLAGRWRSVEDRLHGQVDGSPSAKRNGTVSPTAIAVGLGVLGGDGDAVAV